MAEYSRRAYPINCIHLKGLFFFFNFISNYNSKSNFSWKKNFQPPFHVKLKIPTLLCLKNYVLLTNIYKPYVFSPITQIVPKLLYVTETKMNKNI